MYVAFIYGISPSCFHSWATSSKYNSSHIANTDCSLKGQRLIWSELDSFLFSGHKNWDMWVLYPDAGEQLPFVGILILDCWPKSHLLSSVISVKGFPSLFGLLNRIIIISFLAYSLPTLLHMHYCFLYCLDLFHFQIHLQTQTLGSVWNT